MPLEKVFANVAMGGKRTLLLTAESHRFAGGKGRLRYSRKPVVTEAGKSPKVFYEHVPADEFLVKRPDFLTHHHVTTD